MRFFNPTLWPYALVALSLAGPLSPSPACAQGFSAGSDYSGEEFQNYVPYQPKLSPKKAITPVSQKIPPDKEQSKPETNKEIRDEIKPLKEWTPKELGQLWERGRDKAVMDPSDANVREYMYTQDIILDIATRYSEKQMEIVKNDHILNQSNRISVSSSGEVDAKRLQDKAINVAVDEMAKKGGLLVFVESTCTFCSHQLPILEGLKNPLNPYRPMEYLIISIDARGPNGWKNFVPDNGLFKRLKLSITPSIVYVPNPSAYKEGRDNNKYIVVSQGEIEHLDALTRRIAEVGIKAHIVSKETMKDFDIWNRGVASSKDLSELRLSSKTLHNVPTQVQEIKRNSF